MSRNRRVLTALLTLLLLPTLAMTGEDAIRRLTRRDGKILEERCPVHHEFMVVEVVPILYGLLRPEVGSSTGPREEVEAYWREKQAYFPETSRWIAGGCVVGPEREAEVHVCRACQEAEAAWLKKHPAVGMAARKGP